MNDTITDDNSYTTTIPAGGHWSLRVRKGVKLTLTDIKGGGNVGMLLYNPENLLERYNAPDTLKCQHTFKLTQGNCLHSDMGRIFCSITNDTMGWHDTVCANTTAAIVEKKWGKRDYQKSRNGWKQNGHDSFLVEFEKYGLGGRDMAANINWFSKVTTDEKGNLSLIDNASPAGASVTLRFEMDTLVILHTCPHPLNSASDYPRNPIRLNLTTALPVSDDDECMNHCDENKRGFANNRLYYLGA